MADRDSKSAQVTIGCNGATAVAVLTAAARSFAGDAGLAPATAARLAILVEELVANAREHGGVSDAERIELALGLEQGAAYLTLRDPGRPFDPRLHATGGPNPERGGGAGLELVRNWAEIVDYRRADGWNELRLRLRAA